VKDAPPSALLTAEEGALLLLLARQEVRSAVSGSPAPPPRPPLPESFSATGDVFVTLTRGGRLRGCLGTWKAGGSLSGNLLRAARGAALEDPRFPPVTVPELDGLAVEVTVLDPPAVIAGPDEIVIGRHGVSVSHRLGRGLLLPQVAIEHRVGPEQFLGLVCRKAGLPPDAWRRDTLIEAFSARMFRESGSEEL
jgi:AmmeMemoRadiSam system protein A